MLASIELVDCCVGVKWIKLISLSNFSANLKFIFAIDAAGSSALLLKLVIL